MDTCSEKNERRGGILLEKIWGLALLAGVLLLAPGCALFHQTPDVKNPPFTLRLSLDKTSYCPGEVVRCKIELTNNTDGDISLVAPTVAPDPKMSGAPGSNITFQLLDKKKGFDFRRQPIYPLKNVNVYTIQKIAAQAKYSREFAFCNLTRETGDFALTASYKPSIVEGGPRGEQDLVVGAPVDLLVDGKRVFERDNDDVLKKEDALRIAVARYGKQVVFSEALLRENKMGLLEWHVTLGKSPADTNSVELPKIMYVVDALTCSVRRIDQPMRDGSIVNIGAPRPTVVAGATSTTLSVTPSATAPATSRTLPSVLPQPAATVQPAKTAQPAVTPQPAATAPATSRTLPSVLPQPAATAPATSRTLPSVLPQPSVTAPATSRTLPSVLPQPSVTVQPAKTAQPAVTPQPASAAPSTSRTLPVKPASASEKLLEITPNPFAEIGGTGK